MSRRNVFLLITLLLLTSCSDNGSIDYENTRFYSDMDTSAFIEKLKSNEIPYVLKNNSVYYPVTYRNKVREIAKQVIATAHRPTAYSFKEKKQFDAFKKLLKSRNIAFGETRLNEELIIFIDDKSESAVASDIYKKFIKHQAQQDDRPKAE